MTLPPASTTTNPFPGPPPSVHHPPGADFVREEKPAQQPRSAARPAPWQQRPRAKRKDLVPRPADVARLRVHVPLEIVDWQKFKSSCLCITETLLLCTKPYFHAAIQTYRHLASTPHRMISHLSATLYILFLNSTRVYNERLRQFKHCPRTYEKGSALLELLQEMQLQAPPNHIKILAQLVCNNLLFETLLLLSINQRPGRVKRPCALFHKTALLTLASSSSPGKLVNSLTLP
ncbi:hypothetical protein Pelo_6273 [Pelomyxa schiedti]|nr:hypothetical protein Pelo_6273 [Pelomyxa schiedti]